MGKRKFTDEHRAKLKASWKPKKYSKEARKKLGHWKGKKLSKIHKEKISKSKKGRKVSEQERKRLIDLLKGNSWRLGKKHSFETKEKISIGRSENKKYPYSRWSFLSQKIKLRDKVCQICGSFKDSNKMCVHHIDFNSKNQDEGNLELLCRSCHNKIHKIGCK